MLEAGSTLHADRRSPARPMPEAKPSPGIESNGRRRAGFSLRRGCHFGETATCIAPIGRPQARHIEAIGGAQGLAAAARGRRMSATLGVDVGGTFTDFFLVDEETRRDAHAQGRLHARRSLARDPAGAACARARRRPGLPRPRHHGRHQRADPAARRQGRARHHGRLQGPAGDRPPDAAQDLRSEGRPSRAAGAARAPLRGRRAHRPGGRGDPAARRCRHARAPSPT